MRYYTKRQRRAGRVGPDGLALTVVAGLLADLVPAGSRRSTAARRSPRAGQRREYSRRARDWLGVW